MIHVGLVNISLAINNVMQHVQTACMLETEVVCV